MGIENPVLFAKKHCQDHCQLHYSVCGPLFIRIRLQSCEQFSQSKNIGWGGGTQNKSDMVALLLAARTKTYSWAGRRGYRALPGNQFLIDVSRLEKYHRKRFAMLKTWSHITFLC